MKRLPLLIAAILLSTPLFGARPVARWDVVPHQRVEGKFNVGVVAFHEKGVDVSFTVNGKKVWTAKKPSRNKRTGVVEYVFPFDASKYKDGPVTIGATATTPDEKPYELPVLPLYANSGKTLGSTDIIWVDAKRGNEFASGTQDEPFKSLKHGVQKAGDGGTVYLMPGTYEMKLIGGGKDRKYWTLVSPAPGSEKGSVKVEGGRSGTEKLHFKDIDLFCDVEAGSTGSIAFGEGGDTMGWFEDCRFTNLKGRTGGNVRPFGSKLRAFVTGGETSDMTHGPNAELVRKHVIKDISGEALTGGDLLAVNVNVSGIDPEGAEVVDSNLYQAFAQPPSWIENVILYNVIAKKCNCRGLVGRQLRNSAFVNLGFATSGAGSKDVTHFEAGLENVIFARLRLRNQAWEWLKTTSGHEDLRPKDVRLFDVQVPEGFTGFDSTDGSEGVLVSDDASWFGR